ncbi:flagellar hook assembly protein FlgD [Treponema sp. OMZ 840]|uniref:flagellar hook assembly protein FlgD n=1 Tax=Treponema sp. OMZ 840 TaxID=244313 RepID=UPI003D94B1A0
MEINTKMNAADVAKTQMQVDSFNKSLAVNGRTSSQQLGKDDFLKLLITQLSHQDPLSPMENTEFIAQMAQFSSLEQITNMSSGFNRLASMLTNSEAVSIVGKTVDVATENGLIKGTAEAASRGENPHVVVNGTPYEMKQIERIYAH